MLSQTDLDMSFSTTEPNMASLKEVYDRDKQDGYSFFNMCEDSYRQVNCWWNGKTNTLRKDYAGAKPWPGASDQEVNMIAPRREALASICMNALASGHVQAMPVGSDDLERSAQISNFLRWTLDSWIKNARTHIKKDILNLIDTGIASTFIGWERVPRKSIETLTIEEVAAEDLELADNIVDIEYPIEDTHERIAAGLRQVDRSKIAKIAEVLRSQGFAEYEVVRMDINRPSIQSLSPESEILFPSHTTDVDEVDRVHCVFLMSAQAIRGAGAGMGWNEKWMEDVIQNHMGIDDSHLSGSFGKNSKLSNGRNSRVGSSGYYPDLTVVCRTLRKMVDEETGACGIYETVWCPLQSQRKGDEYYARHAIMEGWDEFPLAVKSYSENRRLYDQRPLVQMLRGTQRQAKVTRDTYTNQADMASAPPMTYPAIGREPPEYGPHAKFPVRAGEQDMFKPIPVPNTRPEGVQYETYLDKEADFIFGLDESPMSVERQRHMINLVLEHVSNILRLVYKAYQKYYDGPDLIFRVTGSPDPQVMPGSPIEEELDIQIRYDSRFTDADYVKQMSQTMLSLKQQDTANRIDPKGLIDMLVSVNAPMWTGLLLRNEQQSQADVLEKVAQDLAIIWSGQQMPARGDGAAIAMEYIDTIYLPKESVQNRIASDPEFAANLNLYRGQYQQQLDQAENAVIGQLGTEAAELQSIQE